MFVRGGCTPGSGIDVSNPRPEIWTDLVVGWSCYQLLQTLLARKYRPTNFWSQTTDVNDVMIWRPQDWLHLDHCHLGYQHLGHCRGAVSHPHQPVSCHQGLSPKIGTSCGHCWQVLTSAQNPKLEDWGSTFQNLGEVQRLQRELKTLAKVVLVFEETAPAWP